MYTIITSVDPLRAYIYNGDVMMRYCLQKYYPFNESVLDKYVLSGNYIPTQDMPSLKPYFNNFGYNMRASFNAYVKSKGLCPKTIWKQVESIIRNILVLKEEEIKMVVRILITSCMFFF